MKLNYSLFYGVSELSQILNVDRDTIKKWAYLFANYLSDGANPTKGSMRQFSFDDVRVFTYINWYWEDEPDVESIKIGLNRLEHHDLPYGEVEASARPIFREVEESSIERGSAGLGGMFDSVDKFTLAGLYRFAGDLLVDSAIKNNEESELLYPIIFTYRHAIELYLKAIIGREEITHDLIELNKKFKEILKSNFNTTPPRWFDNVIIALNDFDPRGVVFRYGEQTYKDEMIVDLSYLRMMMEWISESFLLIKNYWMKNGQ